MELLMLANRIFNLEFNEFKEHILKLESIRKSPDWIINMNLSMDQWKIDIYLPGRLTNTRLNIEIIAKEQETDYFEKDDLEIISKLRSTTAGDKKKEVKYDGVLKIWSGGFSKIEWELLFEFLNYSRYHEWIVSQVYVECDYYSMDELMKMRGNLDARFIISNYLKCYHRRYHSMRPGSLADYDVDIILDDMKIDGVFYHNQQLAQDTKIPKHIIYYYEDQLGESYAPDRNVIINCEKLLAHFENCYLVEITDGTHSIYLNRLSPIDNDKYILSYDKFWYGPDRLKLTGLHGSITEVYNSDSFTCSQLFSLFYDELAVRDLVIGNIAFYAWTDSIPEAFIQCPDKICSGHFDKRREKLEAIFEKLDTLIGQHVAEFDFYTMEAILEKEEHILIADPDSLREIAQMNADCASKHLSDKYGIQNKIIDIGVHREYDMWRLDYSLRLSGDAVNRFMDIAIRDALDRFWFIDSPREMPDESIMKYLKLSENHPGQYTVEMHKYLHVLIFGSFHDVTDSSISFGNQNLFFKYLRHRLLCHFSWYFPKIEFALPDYAFLRHLKSILFETKSSNYEESFEFHYAINDRTENKLYVTVPLKGQVYKVFGSDEWTKPKPNAWLVITYTIDKGKWSLKIQ